MHRSGTSLVTRAMRVLGAEAGSNLLPAADDNPTGFWEDADVNKLNDDMLALVDGRWYDVSALDDAQASRLREEGFEARATALLQGKMRAHDVFVIKDPRLTKLLAFWQPVFEHLDARVSYVIAIRNPVSVAHSLQARDRFPLELSALLWVQHYLSCLSETKPADRAIVDYDSLLGDPSSETQQIAEALVLSVDPDALDELQRNFLSNSLNHHAATEADVARVAWCPRLVEDMFGTLREVALRTTADDDVLKRRVSRWTSEFAKMKVAVGLVDRLHRMTLEQQHHVASADAARHARAAELDAVRGQLDGLEASLAAREQTIGEQQGAIAARDGQLQSQHAAVVERDQRLLEAHATLTEESRKAIDLQERLHQLQLERARLQRAADRSHVELAEERARGEALEGQLRTGQQDLAEEHARLVEVHRHLAASQGRVEATVAEKAGVEHALHVEGERNLQLHASLTMQQTAIDELRQSTSWRLTRPVRWVRELQYALQRRFQTMLDTTRSARRYEGGNLKLARKVLQVLAAEGPRGIGQRIRHLRNLINPNGLVGVDDYATWLSHEHDRGDASRARAMLKDIAFRPKISILLPTYNPDPAMFRSALESVTAQIYDNWELCIADDCSDAVDTRAIAAEFNDRRFKFMRREENGHISAATNSALELATGDYITLLDHDDELSPFALFWVVEKLSRERGLKIVYSDEDKLDENGNRCDPHFKPDWNYDLLLAHNYVCHLATYDAELFRQLGGMRVGYEGAQDYDFVFRAIESVRDDEVGHIPRILYHWRKHEASTASSIGAKPFALDAGRRAVEDHIARTQPHARVTMDGDKMRVQFGLPDNLPKVTIIIPTKDGLDLLRTCVESILAKTDYGNYEIVIVDNNSIEAPTLEYLDAVSGRDNVSVLRDTRPFNFSALNNRAVASTESDFICMLNNDVEVIADSWLSEMVANALRPEVGAVGARLLYSNDTLQHAGIILGVGGVAGHAFKRCHRDDLGYFNRIQIQHEVSAVTGACLLLGRDVFEEVGGMDEEHLAVAFNDVDLCMKVTDAGYKIIYSPFALLYHHESATRGHDDDSPEKFARLQREAQVMNERWGDKLRTDPAYNPNFTIEHENFAIASESRNPSVSEVHAMLKAGQQAG